MISEPILKTRIFPPNSTTFLIFVSNKEFSFQKQAASLNIKTPTLGNFLSLQTTPFKVINESHSTDYSALGPLLSPEERQHSENLGARDQITDLESPSTPHLAQPR